MASATFSVKTDTPTKFEISSVSDHWLRTSFYCQFRKWNVCWTERKFKPRYVKHTRFQLCFHWIPIRSGEKHSSRNTSSTGFKWHETRRFFRRLCHLFNCSCCSEISRMYTLSKRASILQFLINSLLICFWIPSHIIHVRVNNFDEIRKLDNVFEEDPCRNIHFMSVFHVAICPAPNNNVARLSDKKA